MQGRLDCTLWCTTALCWFPFGRCLENPPRSVGAMSLWKQVAGCLWHQLVDLCLEEQLGGGGRRGRGSAFPHPLVGRAPSLTSGTKSSSVPLLKCVENILVGCTDSRLFFSSSSIHYCTAWKLGQTSLSLLRHGVVPSNTVISQTYFDSCWGG